MYWILQNVVSGESLARFATRKGALECLRLNYYGWTMPKVILIPEDFYDIQTSKYGTEEYTHKFDLVRPTVWCLNEDTDSYKPE